MIKMNIDLKARFRNKAFWVAMTSAIGLLLQQLGINWLPDNYKDIVNTILVITTMLGITVDTSTSGISDQIVSTSTVQAINATNTSEEVKTEDSTTAINNNVTENSQSDTINQVEENNNQ
jgi:uncharacterized membrane protein